VAGKYRALLIGNSTYPADEHNLQILKGPVKDIAALNRALIDSDTGLFDDIDVTLLPEATSSRTLRTLSRFFGSADRDDVLLVYFSGHGKLDQNGRLHLCMQDTETTDLLSTAVSSTRINEFAEASRARNVVIVLDCCHAGAFRGGDFGDAVAGPGRYVLTSCRGTQLANDATVENGTSYFTQHLVDGLLGEAADRDQDGFVDFSDLYSYVDRRLREENKQIPQRRVDGDGDLRLARRPPRAQAVPAASETTESAAAVATAGGTQPRSTVPMAAAAGTAPPSTGSRWTRRRIVIAALAGAAVVAGAVVATLLLTSGGGPGSHASPGHGAYTASGPWRIRIDGTVYGSGCKVTLKDTSGTPTPFDMQGVIYDEIARYQIPQAGKFTWTTTDRSCLVTPLPGMGKATLPFTQTENGDTNVFAAPRNGVSVHIVDNKGSRCTLRLFDSKGDELATAQWQPGDGDLTLDTLGAASVYVFDDDCVIRLTAHI
jgi:type 1 fimbria pilin